MSYVTTKPTVAVEKIARNGVSEFPFRVFSYQFKDLGDARRFAKSCEEIPRTVSGPVPVQMFHRSIELRRTVTDDKGKSEASVQSVVLDVTTKSPEQAEAEWRQ